MPKSKRVRIGLSNEDDIIAEFRFDERHQLVGFAVTYVARIEGRDVEVGRYDTAHGRPHAHQFWPTHRMRRLSTSTPRKTLATRAIEDYRENWRKYRARIREAST